VWFRLNRRTESDYLAMALIPLNKQQKQNKELLICCSLTLCLQKELNSEELHSPPDYICSILTEPRVCRTETWYNR
jgi:hypothetical protein